MTTQHHILVTGAAGFIGFHLSLKLLRQGHRVCGLDNLSPYYSVDLKKDRLAMLHAFPDFRFAEIDMADQPKMSALFAESGFSHVVNLAAQAGVRHSLTHPEDYVSTNLVGFSHILEGCRQTGVTHCVFASSSSVYGLNTRMPFSVHDNVDHPISLYAATKKANELMAHTYSHLYGLRCTGLRFFTVYGPWGRPDMALFLFTKAIMAGEPIQVFNHGKMRRDFTYIDDIVEGVSRIIPTLPQPNPEWNSDTPDPASSIAPYRLYNIGNNRCIELAAFIEIIEQQLGKKAIKNYLPMQPGDVPASHADIDDLFKAVGFRPDTTMETGIARFLEWYRSYYKV